jgi:flagellar FliL protein
MATQAIEQVSDDAPAAAPDKPARKAPIALILGVIGILAGVGAGLFGVGPILAKRRAAPAQKHADPTAAAVVHPIENLVLNPAESGGTRFLMVTATFELKDSEADRIMKEHEAEVRDNILALLGRKSVTELTDITLRDGIKREVLAAVAPLFPKGAVRKVFFPQFVIQ